MKLVPALVFALVAVSTPAFAQECRQCSDAIRVTANFQAWAPVDKDLSGPDLAKAFSAASQPLYDVVSRQCEVLAAEYKGDCRLVEMNVNTQMPDRRMPQFVPPGANMVQQQQRVNANANAIYEITPVAADKTPAKP